MKYLLIIISLISIFILVILLEVILAFLGERKPFKNPQREFINIGGKGKSLTYLVMGDSTSSGRGGVYAKGIAYSSARFLAKDHQVRMLNISISGATVKDVLSEQLQVGIKTNPDIVLISVGANDVTHLTSLSSFEKNMSTIIEKLIQKNCKIKIILTGAPAMGSVTRFMQPLRYIAGVRTNQVNDVVKDIVKKYDLTFAPIAYDTGEQFSKDATLFAEDRFHPNDRGYALWIPVINKSLKEALKNQPSHCE